jgi:hypothetical protein
MGSSIVTYALIFYDKCKMKFMNNGFNMSKIDGSTDVPN